ncbi:unnamed protein product [Lepeophtheirus salmonis]|uniref:(salmon louse) hypothetical protein n=1 Tax=Lepeophtheirus salmonis TaxID=72036 RepID=A0A7R8H2I7_LEPSM|nr:unnamed protein product [Lepeophtheirus salmonis]CAF2827403.1 unnamed protein product [Lepeophtheirus salmonis]
MLLKWIFIITALLHLRFVHGFKVPKRKYPSSTSYVNFQHPRPKHYFTTSTKRPSIRFDENPSRATSTLSPFTLTISTKNPEYRYSSTTPPVHQLSYRPTTSRSQPELIYRSTPNPLLAFSPSPLDPPLFYNPNSQVSQSPTSIPPRYLYPQAFIDPYNQERYYAPRRLLLVPQQTKMFILKQKMGINRLMMMETTYSNMKTIKILSQNILNFIIIIVVLTQERDPQINTRNQANFKGTHTHTIQVPNTRIIKIKKQSPSRFTPKAPRKAIPNVKIMEPHIPRSTPEQTPSQFAVHPPPPSHLIETSSFPKTYPDRRLPHSLSSNPRRTSIPDIPREAISEPKVQIYNNIEDKVLKLPPPGYKIYEAVPIRPNGHTNRSGRKEGKFKNFPAEDEALGNSHEDIFNLVAGLSSPEVAFLLGSEELYKREPLNDEVMKLDKNWIKQKV